MAEMRADDTISPAYSADKWMQDRLELNGDLEKSRWVVVSRILFSQPIFFPSRFS
jgi:hypothetical protein